MEKEASRPPGSELPVASQARFDGFVREFKEGNPRAALAMKRHAGVYAPSPRPYDGLPDLASPLDGRDVLVTACGRICMHRERINIPAVMAGQRLGTKKAGEEIGIVSFMDYDLGHFDLEQGTLQP